MSATADDMIDSWEQTPQSPAAAAPPPADPLKNDAAIYQHAYGLAAKAGDMAAMQELHGHLLNTYQKIAVRDSNPAEGGGHLFPGSQPGLDQTAEGFGHGLSKVGDTLLSGADAIGAGEGGEATPHAPLTDAKLDAPLLATSRGAVGDIAGQGVATLPVGAAGGAVSEALGAGKLAGTGVAKLAGRVSARTAQAGGEGAAASGLSGEDPLTGAGAGAALSLPLSMAGRVVNGIVRKSEPAEHMIKDAAAEGKNLHIPISQGGEGPVAGAYKTVLPYFFGAREQLDSQSKKAQKIYSDTLMTHAPVPQTDATGTLVKSPVPEGDTPQATAANIRKQSDAAYDRTVKNYAFQPPEDFHGSVLDNLTGTDLPTGHKQQIASTLDNILQSHLSDDGTLSGANLLRAKAAGREALGNLRSAGGLASLGNPASTETALGSFDNMIDNAIKNGRTATKPGVIPSKNMLAEFQAKYPEEAGVGQLGQRVNGNSTAELYMDPGDPNTVHLEKLRSDLPGTGAGSAALKNITGLADKHGTNMTLSAIPLDKGGISQPDLIKFYQKAGFKLDGNGEATMTRKAAPNPQIQADLQNFKRLQEHYGESNAILSTSEGNVANKGTLAGQWGRLAKAAPDDSQVQRMAQDAHEVFGESAGGVDPAGRHVLNLAKETVGPGLAGFVGGPAAALGSVGLANALATKTFQRGLYGDTDTQRFIANLLRKNPNAAHLADFATRQGVIDNASRQ